MTSNLVKKTKSILIGLILSLIVLELLLRALPVSEGFHQLAVNDDNPVIRFEENRDFIFSNDWNFSIVTAKHSNNFGFLNDQDYFKQETTPLMAIIGDSYVEALHVEDKLAMHGILAEEIASDQGRVYSFGVSGTPLPTYLVYAKYIYDEFQPTSMVFIIVNSDFGDSLAKYHQKKGTYHFHLTNDGELELQRSDFEPDIMKIWARKSALLRYLYFNLDILDKDIFNRITEFFEASDNSAKYGEKTLVSTTDIERISVTKKAVDIFFNLLPSYANLKAEDIVFLVDGMRPQIYSDIGLEMAQESFMGIMRRYFMDEARRKGYEVIDMQPEFLKRNREDGSRFEFETDAHWNALAHQLVAEAIQASTVYSSTFGIK